MRKIKIVCAAMLVGACLMTAPSVRGGPIDGLESAKEAVVKILSRNGEDKEVSGSGFVFGEKGRIITALHIIAGSDDIRVRFEEQGLTRKGKVVSVLRRSDLVVLQVENAPDTPVFQASASPPNSGEELWALGFPLSVPSMKSAKLSVREVGGKKIKDSLPDSARRKVEEFGFPDINTRIIDIEGALVPGHSGAPIFRKNGQLVGIANGGLERGIGGISWAIPASELNELLLSAEKAPTPHELRKGDVTVEQLYGAELRVDVDGDTVKLGTFSFRKVRTRTLAEVAATSDDVFGLAQFQGLFSAFQVDTMAFNYDVYEHADSGAAFVVPAGLAPKARNDHWVVDCADGVVMKMQFVRQRGGNLPQATQKMATLLHGAELPYWVGNPAWSYPTPRWRPDGVWVYRSAAVRGQFGPLGYYQTGAGFLTAAQKMDHLMTAGVVWTKFNDPLSGPDWAKAVIAVHLTSFSFSGPITTPGPPVF